MIDAIVNEQFEQVRRAFPDAELLDTTGQRKVVKIPNFPLPIGWNQPATTIYFIIPNGYPQANPDTFWADASLRLAGGGEPQATNRSNVDHGLPLPGLIWFSWHPSLWRPNHDTLLNYVRVIAARLREVR